MPSEFAVDAKRGWIQRLTRACWLGNVVYSMIKPSQAHCHIYILYFLLPPNVDACTSIFVASSPEQRRITIHRHWLSFREGADHTAQQQQACQACTRWRRSVDLKLSSTTVCRSKVMSFHAVLTNEPRAPKRYAPQQRCNLSADMQAYV